MRPAFQTRLSGAAILFTDFKTAGDVSVVGKFNILIASRVNPGWLHKKTAAPLPVKRPSSPFPAL